MYYFDLRYAILVVINIVKSQTGMPWDWDPFDTIGHLTWMKFWLLTILFMLFSSTSISLPLTSQLNMGHIRVQVGGFSAIFVLLLVASVLTPETLFWYAYPIMILLSSCSAWLSNILKSFLQWVQTVLSMVPDLKIFISTTYAEAANPEPQPAVQGIMGPNFEDGGAQV